MINKYIVKVDRQGRILIPSRLRELANIKLKSKFAICSGRTEKELKLKEVNNVLDEEVLAIVKMDDKGRIFIPKEILQNTKELRLFVRNEELFIREAR